MCIRDRLQSLQSGITTQIQQDVGTVNGLLQNIAQLNGQIQQYNVQNPNSTPNDLVDQRQADVEQLAGYMNCLLYTSSPRYYREK